jgi:hypothetical protein
MMIYLYRKHKKRKAAAAKAEAEKAQGPVLTTNEKASDPQAIAAVDSEPQEIPTTKPVVPEESAEDKRRRRVYRWKLVLSLCLPGFLAAVDTTIVATALTTIASHFSMTNSPVVRTKLTVTRSIKPIQLDCYSVHFDLYSFYSGFWAVI